MCAFFPTQDPRGYIGTRATRPPQQFFHNRAPLTTDNSYSLYSIGDEWLDQSIAIPQWYKLVSNKVNVAIWVPFTQNAIQAIQTINTIPPDGSDNFTIVAGTGVVITPGVNQITIDFSGGLPIMTWNLISVNTVGVTNNGYLAVAPGGAITISLPAVSSVGDVFEVALDGAASWQITQGIGQQVRMGRLNTTLGPAGSITTSGTGEAVRLVCRAANTLWTTLSSMGNFFLA